MNEQTPLEPQQTTFDAGLDQAGETPDAPIDPLAGDFVEQQQFERAAGSAGRPKLNRSTLILVGVFLAGAGAVAFLAMRGGPKEATASDKDLELKVEQFIARDTAKKVAGTTKTKADDLADTRKVVDEFYNFASRRQVPLDNLKSNPFVFGDGEEESTPAEDNTRAAKRAAAEAAAKRKKALAAELAKLTLQSVMGGRRGNTAIINNNFVAINDSLGSFVVKSISGRSVELAAGETTFTLSLKD